VPPIADNHAIQVMQIRIADYFLKEILWAMINLGCSYLLFSIVFNSISESNASCKLAENVDACSFVIPGYPTIADVMEPRRHIRGLGIGSW
jgi:hypothetical protein